MDVIKRITLIRHGATEYNDQDLMQGQIDLPLSDRGRKQAEQLREELKDRHFDIIFHSPLKRAYQTAEIVNETHRLDYIPIDCFKEINIGEWEGDKFSDVFTKHKEIYQKWIVDSSVKIPGGESYVEVQNRVKAGVLEILNSKYTDILIFGHAAVNRGILGNMLRMSPDLSRKFRFNNCAYSTFWVFENRFKSVQRDDLIADQFVSLENWNVSTHLKDN